MTSDDVMQQLLKTDSGSNAMNSHVSGQRKNPVQWPRTDSHPIDAFIASKIEHAVAAASSTDALQAEHFHSKILPILRENCFRCHGEKDKGGLKLNSRTASLKAGDSESPAVIPGDVEASELIRRIRDGDMPPTDDRLDHLQIELLEQWVEDGAPWPARPIAKSEVALSPVIDDASFFATCFSGHCRRTANDQGGADISGRRQTG